MANEGFEEISPSGGTDADRIARLEREVRRLSQMVAELRPLANRVEAMERKWKNKEANDRSIGARFGRR